MKEEGALLAGEMSGHIFFADSYYGYDDAIYAPLRLLKIIKDSGKPYRLRKLLSDIPDTVSSPEIRIECPDHKKFNVVELVKKEFSDYPHISIDGIRIQFKEGWSLVRASNTQPAIVIRFEAISEDKMRDIEKLVRHKLDNAMKRSGIN
jgi:phosphomannomutase/phosphoglucomutase